MAAVEEQNWTGWVMFGGIVMIIAGAFDALLGLTAILLPSNEYLFLTDEAVILLDAAGWGWWHLIIGAAMVLVGIFVLRGATWARMVGVVLVSINAISQMGLLGVQPLWSLIMILLDIIVIYALIVHGREMKRT
jgi:multisubunit Na+/H+ antiporter MnhF subunit